MKLQLVAKNEKKIEGGTLWRHEKISQKNFLMRFLNSVTVPKNVKGWPFAIFWHPLCCKTSKKLKGGPFGGKISIQKVSKTRIVPKKVGGSLVWFRGCGRLFCFFFSLWTRFWGWSCWGLKLLRFEVVEQTNKKVELSCLKKTTHCNSRAHFLLKCAD